MYCPADKETCKQSELKKVHALHSTAHDKLSPSDPALFFSHQAYIDKNFMEWQTSMMEKKRFVDPVERVLGHHDQSDQQPDLTNKNYFGYPRQATLSEWNDNVAKFEGVPLVQNFDLQQWIDLLGRTQITDDDAIAIYKAHAAHTDADDFDKFFNTLKAEDVYPDFPSPQEGSLTYNLTNGARTYASSGPFIYM